MPPLPATDRASTTLGRDRVLELVTRTIAERLRPTRIVLFGSRARGTASADSDYDIMVEMETDLPQTERDDQVYDLFDDPDWKMDVFVYTPEEVRRWRDDVGMILHDIVREGRVLYCRPDVTPDFGVTGATPASARVHERPRDVPESTEQWLARTQQDFAVMHAVHDLAAPAWGAVCFHAHQSVEKLLKATLISRSIRPPRTHSLPELLRVCQQAGIDLPGMRGPCRRLQRLYARSRYPTEKEPTRSDAASAIAAAEALRDAVLPLLTSAE